MKGFARNLRFWGVTLHKALFNMVATIAVILIFFALMEGGNFFEEYGRQVPFYLVMLAFIFAFVNGLNGITGQFPLTVSLGSTRKHSYIAMQLVQHLIMAEFLLAFYAWIYFVMFKREKAFGEPYFMLAAGIVLLVLGLCQVTSAATVRFGRTIGVIVYIISVIVVIAAMAGFVISDSEKFIMQENTLSVLLEGPWILLAGAVFDVVMLFVLYAQIRKSNLQFS